ncbi:pyridoxamine 5'-phosphate oxidase family protein [Streptomyces sp. Tue 6430]|nr:pyridoxamine 5'-phosphate oxidase family protein [Streptomyces sp. Tue 6430]
MTDTAVDGPGGAAGSGWVELGSRAELREVLGEPWPVVIEKVHDRLTGRIWTSWHARPSACWPPPTRTATATSPARGRSGVHPRRRRAHARPADRPGNRRGDSFHNILDNPHAGLLYLVPGGKEVLRVNGRARVLTDAPFFDAMARDGRRPRSPWCWRSTRSTCTARSRCGVRACGTRGPGRPAGTEPPRVIKVN